MSERRSAPRKKSFLQGRIHYNNRRSSADCLIRDITETGARLTFSDTVTVPEAFELYVPNKQESFRARMKWHRGREIGVAFESELPQADSPRLAPSASASLEERVSKLERDLAALRRRLEPAQD